MSAGESFDVVVIGAGPAGQKAAIQASKAGRSVVMIEQSASVGGECVHRGTIPSKTLRETAVYLSGLSRRSEGLLDPHLRPDLKLESLMRRQDTVRHAHERFIARQLERNDVAMRHGRARFVSPHVLEVVAVGGSRTTIEGAHIILATGSRPRTPANVPVDHEHVLDSDSILSLLYLPTSLTVLGAGVIACEFASIFAALGVHVTIVDKADRPLAFLERELTDAFLADFETHGGRYLGGLKVATVTSDALRGVTTRCENGEEIHGEKLFCALGRVAEVACLRLEAAGLATDARGQIPVDTCYRTAVPHIYAVGDVIGPPSLAATSMEQGRRAARHLVGLPSDDGFARVPVGIYTIPEMASIGLGEAQAIEAHGAALVGRARFDELARGHISGDVRGMLKLVATADGSRLLGAHIAGEGATEIIHVAQMAIAGGLGIDTFVDNVFNFPTMAEAYRVAALDATGRLQHSLRAAA